MSHLAPLERQALCDTFDAVGPGAPTLCDPWDTADLAAHLVVRERRPDIAAGIHVPPLASWGRAGRDAFAARPWPELVALVRSGPPAWSPMRVPAVDELVNLPELYLHHEDVLRATAPGPVRDLDPALEAALWTAVRRTARLGFRGVRVGIVLVAPGHGRYAVRGPGEAGTAVLTGAPGELLLAASGRMRVADLDLSGPPEAVAAVSGP